MPTYEFRCPAGHKFEKFYRKISDAPSDTLCPGCGQVAERQVSGGAGLVFKGSGFYITDYGKDGKKERRPAAETKPDTAPSGEAKSSDSTPTETKPAAKAPDSSGGGKGSAGPSSAE